MAIQSATMHATSNCEGLVGGGIHLNASGYRVDGVKKFFQAYFTPQLGTQRSLGDNRYDQTYEVRLVDAGINPVDGPFLLRALGTANWTAVPNPDTSINPVAFLMDDFAFNGANADGTITSFLLNDMMGAAYPVIKKAGPYGEGHFATMTDLYIALAVIANPS